MIAFILCVVQPGTEEDVIEKISNMKNVIEVHELYGEYDMIVKVNVKELGELDILTSSIRRVPGVQMSSTMIKK
ncbi:MAG: putative HTH-type transcriptional regulator [Candidatus Methanofastidiosum methylothiophilum]|jgi:DNA-binding Lrp family transcriptional regulator|uniref:Putative HTH-type transcriptional regulator n=1 Tax=Candidatus Methanofastidiosum methylothiophilum TaxID=1705564 RepID=A0A150IRE7_9EURY|nr:MAG: putative HTH-type transcriptional regulator [Candidatus Methanofastidiosum methylthiophilus]NPV50361.1 Lrp/AsnC ligand binding domain-containing protein [Methanofastidiosum sp.]NYT03085.1 Lrp/AsnC family transcriptional regulator [Candidatus Methanofastidiosa archaeon]KYC47609.1 MAG: putative HTH-type transcriptional regulator [Candidatus Methanofastidiosum methylthiophilus]KYC49395.1 MAG: putative HTH-type transcriptional regulator [Candidatus Methanofastidiosum methylthiophilus]